MSIGPVGRGCVWQVRFDSSRALCRASQINVAKTLAMGFCSCYNEDMNETQTAETTILNRVIEDLGRVPSKEEFRAEMMNILSKEASAQFRKAFATAKA